MSRINQNSFRLTREEMQNILTALETINTPYLKMNGDFAENAAVKKDFDRAIDLVSKRLETHKVFFAEVTDTYDGEANYCWVHRFRISAKNIRGAMQKLSKEIGYRFRRVSDYGDMKRYNAQKACVCAFVSEWDNDSHLNYSNVKEI